MKHSVILLCFQNSLKHALFRSHEEHAFLTSVRTDILIMVTNFARIGITRRIYALKHTLVIFRDTTATFLQNSVPLHIETDRYI